ncbi:hypothetical protein BOO69_10850 [Sulfitobacter alexandrii]|uniref:DUF2155 domain-containing protein n=1 Tax=Sulfitobacter alexandrii TaxID=1917485 RepID=A0A1J0WM91_9RHOB|nr:DUF2155 domain-containing protein [Sulfitobacter alexandrii]APE45426.1 hypothetical protein BOO69_10850 [Sulfitobacter alexandrii]
MIRHLLFAAVLALPAAAQEVSSAPGAVLRTLDKISGHSLDVELRTGQSSRLGNLDIVLNECRYPAGDPSGDAYAELEISDINKSDTLFSGWMIASAPALSALEHPRYDVWVIRCTTS